MALTTLHLVRHGQSQWNLERRLQGQVADVPLTELGHQQAAATAQTLRSQQIVAVYSSDQRRALQTAAPIAASCGQVIRPEPGLRERDYGSFEGQPSADVYAATTGIDWTDPSVRIGGGESLLAVFNRISATLTRIAAEHDGSTVVLVSHGDTIRAAAAWAAGHEPAAAPWLDVANGSVTTVLLG